jgi:hypothetical protein
MGKKCIPGLFCVENMTLFLSVLVMALLVFIFTRNTEKIIVVQSPATVAALGGGSGAISGRRDPFNDPYAPPLKNDGMFFPPDSSDIRGIPKIPINVQTRGADVEYQQVGILTRDSDTATNNGNPLILPLMGRRIMSGRDKSQYYTISNTGSVNTKLPIRVNGRSCTGEYGCDEINSRDVVYVEGYNNAFKVTIYENNMFRYMPPI